jgi:biotin operon repressor
VSRKYQKTAERRECSPEAIDSATVERLALAVAKPGSDALVIDQDNQSADRMPISEAAGSGVCFAIELAEDVVGLDADNKGAARWVATWLMSELERRKIPPVVLNSGRPGHLHLFARVTDPALKQEIEIAARFAGCNVRAGQRIRPPLSPHRSGLPVSLVTPANAAQALLALAPIDEQKPTIKRRGPSGRIFALLRDGYREGHYNSRSEVIQAIALAAVNQQYSEEWLFTVLRNPQNRAGEKVQRMTEAEARRYVARSYCKAQAYAAAHPAFGHRGEAVAAIREKIDRATDLILLSAGSGQTGATDYSVTAAHLTIARRIGSLTYGASDREVAQLAGVSRPTVIKAHRRLVKRGVLKRIRRPVFGATTASQWRIGLPSESVADITNPVLMGGVRLIGKADHTTPGADLWRRGGLGKSKCRVWSLLATPQTAAQLAPQLNIKVRSVWDHLWALEEQGLCVRDHNGRWHRQRNVNFDVVAKRLGVAGAGARQRAFHQHEREVFRQQVHRHRAQVHLRMDKAVAVIGTTDSKPGETLTSCGDSDYSNAIRRSECKRECGGEYDPELAETIATVERVFPGARLVKLTR